MACEQCQVLLSPGREVSHAVCKAVSDLGSCELTIARVTIVTQDEAANCRPDRVRGLGM